MRTRSLLFAVCLVAACASPPGRDAGDATGSGPGTLRFVVVRHAEKATDDPRDPSLSAAGQARARWLARRLQGQDLVAVYATGYRRTQQTVAPVAGAHGLAISTYDAAQPFDEFAQALLDAHHAGTVLVAGHSNTVPGIVAALCRCASAAMPEDEFDRISIIRLDAGGGRTLQVEHDPPTGIAP
jgi:broad specificity phosphatase PhoE